MEAREFPINTQVYRCMKILIRKTGIHEIRTNVDHILEQASIDDLQFAYFRLFKRKVKINTDLNIKDWFREYIRVLIKSINREKTLILPMDQGIMEIPKNTTLIYETNTQTSEMLNIPQGLRFVMNSDEPNLFKYRHLYTTNQSINNIVYMSKFHPKFINLEYTRNIYPSANGVYNGYELILFDSKYLNFKATFEYKEIKLKMPEKDYDSFTNQFPPESMLPQFPKWIINDSRKTPLDYSGFLTTPESQYYSLLPFQIYQVRKFIHRYVKDPKVIIDGTSHIGCDAVNLAQMYPGSDIHPYEIDPDVYKILIRNLQYYSSKYKWDYFRFKPTNQSFTQNISELPKADLVYLDPPWGGPDYKNKKELSLELSGIQVQYLIKDILDTKVKHVILKTPFNYKKTDLDIFTRDKYRVASHDILTPGKKISYTLWIITAVPK